MAAGYELAAARLPTAAYETVMARCSAVLAGLAVVAVLGLELEATQVRPLPVAQLLLVPKHTL